MKLLLEIFQICQLMMHLKYGYYFMRLEDKIKQWMIKLLSNNILLC